MDGGDRLRREAPSSRRGAGVGVALLFAHLAVVAGVLCALLATPAPRATAAAPALEPPAPSLPAAARTVVADDAGGGHPGQGHHPRKRGLELDRGPIARAPLPAITPPAGLPDLHDPLVARPSVDDEVPRPRIARAPPRG